MVKRCSIVKRETLIKIKSSFTPLRRLRLNATSHFLADFPHLLTKAAGSSGGKLSRARDDDDNQPILNVGKKEILFLLSDDAVLLWHTDKHVVLNSFVILKIVTWRNFEISRQHVELMNSRHCHITEKF